MNNLNSEPTSDNTVIDEESENQIPWSTSQPPATTKASEPIPGKVRVAVDWAELEGALENNSPDLHSFFNKKTGDVIRIFNGHEEVDRRLQDVEADPAYIYIEPISSREQYKWMEEFIETIEPSPLRDKLQVAVDGKGAFRRFKDVLMEDTTHRELWFSKRAEKLQIHITEWLAAKNLDPVNPAPWNEGHSTRRFETVRRNRYITSNGRHFGTSFRRKAHELVDLVPSKELPMAVAFLEFLGSKNYPGKD